jgi:hypothetical protein
LIFECMCGWWKELPYMRWMVMHFGWNTFCSLLLWANCSLWIGISAARIQSFRTHSRLLTCCMIRNALVTCHFTGERDVFCRARCLALSWRSGVQFACIRPSPTLELKVRCAVCVYHDFCFLFALRAT